MGSAEDVEARVLKSCLERAVRCAKQPSVSTSACVSARVVGSSAFEGMYLLSTSVMCPNCVRKTTYPHSTFLSECVQ